MTNSLSNPAGRHGDETHYDSGLHAYMLSIYNYMAGALLLTGIVAFYAAHTIDFLNAMYVMQGDTVTGMRPLAWVVMLAPLGFIILLNFSLPGISVFTAQLAYWAYAVLIGMSLSIIFLTFTGTSIAHVFFITAAMFGGTSLYGHSTRHNLTRLQSFLFMSLIGIILASLFNLFLRRPELELVLSIAGVLVFAGLTAYDTQKLKQLYCQLSAGSEWYGKVTIIGALTLYLDFINIFLNLLSLFGERKK